MQFLFLQRRTGLTAKDSTPHARAGGRGCGLTATNNFQSSSNGDFLATSPPQRRLSNHQRRWLLKLKILGSLRPRWRQLVVTGSYSYRKYLFHPVDGNHPVIALLATCLCSKFCCVVLRFCFVVFTRTLVFSPLPSRPFHSLFLISDLLPSKLCFGSCLHMFGFRFQMYRIVCHTCLNKSDVLILCPILGVVWFDAIEMTGVSVFSSKCAVVLS